MSRRPEFAAALGVLIACGLARWAGAQTTTRWNRPAELQTLDFRSEGAKRKVRLTDDGLAYEIPLEFMMVGHKRVRIEAELGEPGEFRIEQANPRALVDVKNVRVEGERGKAEVEARVTAMSRSDATARARDAVAKIWDPVERQLAPQLAHADAEQIRSYLAEREVDLWLDQGREVPEAKLREIYLQERTRERVFPDFRRALAELVKRKPAWVATSDRLRWERTEDRTLLDAYHKLMEYEAKDAHLRRLGLSFDSNIAEFETRLDDRFDAVWLAMSGKVGEDQEQTRRMVQALGVGDLRRLHDALSVELRCRFHPATDPDDPNAQWFNAQRVACQSKKVASIRLQGKLDAAKHDRVDWWILDDFDEAQVLLDVQESPGFRVDPPFRDKRAVCLRVVATGEGPIRYALDFRPRRKKDGLAVVIYESPAAGDTGFPY
jgi:hypothetical protein